MKRFRINFRKSISDRAGEYSARAYNHYLRFKPVFDRIGRPIKQIHNKYLSKFRNGKS